MVHCAQKNMLPKLQKEIDKMTTTIPIIKSIRAFINQIKAAKREKTIDDLAQSLYLSGRTPNQLRLRHYIQAKKKNRSMSWEDFEIRFNDLVKVIEDRNASKRPMMCVRFMFEHTDHHGAITLHYPLAGANSSSRAMTMFRFLHTCPMTLNLRADLQERKWSGENGYDHAHHTPKVRKIIANLRQSCFESK